MLVGSLIAKLASGIVGGITKDTNITRIARISVNAFALLAALTHLVTPLAASFNGFMGSLSLSGLQADAAFIGVLLVVLFANRNAVTKTVDSLLNS